MSDMTFVEKCLSGSARPEEIEDYVDFWHTGGDNRELYQYLGLTLEEYSRWVENPSTLDQILGAKKRNLTVREAV